MDVGDNKRVAFADRFGLKGIDTSKIIRVVDLKGVGNSRLGLDFEYPDYVHQS